MNARVSSLSGLALLAIAGACSRSSSSSPPVLVTAILGPEGGVLTVDQGVQDGLILTVPPGAVSEPTTFRVVDDARGLPPTVRGVSVAPQPGFALRIEPRDLVLAEKATLRLPYRPFQVTSTAPGNVRVQHDNPVASLQYYPEAVDVGEAWVEVRTATLDRFQVVVGPSADRPQDYLPDDEDLALLGDGWTFVVEPVEATSPFAQQDARRWRLRGPSFDESLILVGDRVVAREADLDTTAAWRELWDESYPLFGSTAATGGGGLTTNVRVERPIGFQLPFAGQVSVFGYWQFTEPRALGSRLVVDVLRIRLDIAWSRTDLGTGQRQLVFWLSPDDGLLALSVDGVVRERFAP